MMQESAEKSLSCGSGTGLGNMQTNKLFINGNCSFVNGRAQLINGNGLFANGKPLFTNGKIFPFTNRGLFVVSSSFYRLHYKTGICRKPHDF